MRRIGRVVVPVLALALLMLGRSESKPVARPEIQPLSLRLLSTHALSFAEPSDLTINESGTVLWTVTNHPARVYQLDLNGNVVQTLHYAGADLEAIAYDRSDKTLWVVEERRREIIHLDLRGDVLSKTPLDLAGEPNSGPEGICLDEKHRMFLLNEKRPGLFVELNADLSIAAKQGLDFAKDYSGLAYDRKKACFWIVSDQSKKLYLWSKKKGVLGEYSLPFRKAEGVAVDEAANRIYIVSDSENKLYVYEMSPANESAAAR
jgi:uncharacterized protein YjiK